MLNNDSAMHNSLDGGSDGRASVEFDRDSGVKKYATGPYKQFFSTRPNYGGRPYETTASTFNPVQKSAPLHPRPMFSGAQGQYGAINYPDQPSNGLGGQKNIFPGYKQQQVWNQGLYNPPYYNQKPNWNRFSGQTQNTWNPYLPKPIINRPGSVINQKNPGSNVIPNLVNRPVLNPYPISGPRPSIWGPPRYPQWGRPSAPINSLWPPNRFTPPLKIPSFPIPNIPQKLVPPLEPRPTTSPISSGSRGYGGKATYYTEWNGNPGSCGYIPKQDNIVAVASQFMPASCGRCILIKYRGKELKAVVTDTCEACSSNPKWIDLSHTLFGRFDSMSLGVLQVDWDFCEC